MSNCAPNEPECECHADGAAERPRVDAARSLRGGGERSSAHTLATRDAPVFAGLDCRQPRLMGVINVTPDSFSDGGEAATHDAAVARGLALRDEGADILDVGGESTRPGAAPVPVDEELRRVVPVIRTLAAAGARVSVDTRRSAVMRAATAAGAVIINDITALTGDADSLAVAAASGAAVVLMHMQGEPRTMQHAPHYADAAADVFDWLSKRLAACEAAGIPRDRLAVDPGIGFGKSLEHNLQILASLDRYRALDCALLLGVSRKSFISQLGGGVAVRDRLPGSLAAALDGIRRGVHILRVHDVAATRLALFVQRAIAGYGEVI